MCLICIDFDRGALNLNDARRALGEMRVSLDPAHAAEVDAKLERAEHERDDGGTPPSSSGPALTKP